MLVLRENLRQQVLSMVWRGFHHTGESQTLRRLCPKRMFSHLIQWSQSGAKPRTGIATEAGPDLPQALRPPTAKAPGTKKLVPVANPFRS